MYSLWHDWDVRDSARGPASGDFFSDRREQQTGLSPRLPSQTRLHVAGLLFDVGDVLYDATMWRRWLLQLLSRLGLHTHYRAFYHVFEHEFLGSVYCGRRDYWDALRAFLLSAGLSRGQADEVIAAGYSRRRQLEEHIRPFPGVLATLAQLAAGGWQLAAICNAPWPAAQIREHLDQLGLASRFPIVLSSFDLGCTLPAAEAFDAALSAMQLAAADVAFVGHDTRELSGASSAGLKTIAFNYEPDAVADLLLERFDELPSSVEQRCAHLLAG
jgi:FMN phosphatase YigB (HAD superfamily)